MSAALGRLVTAAGMVEMLSGAAAWTVVRTQLANERIVVPATAARFPNQTVRGPLTAFEQADVVRRTTLKATDGRTYGEMAEDDPMAKMSLEAALIRSSLFTSVLAFGIAASQVALGAVFILVGKALTGTGGQVTTLQSSTHSHAP
jgi:hypothetical protein